MRRLHSKPGWRAIAVAVAGCLAAWGLAIAGVAAAQGPPTVTSVSPNLGPIAGGTAVTIGGGGFTGAKKVSFGPNKASSFSVVSDTQIKATSPAGQGTVDVTVTTPGGTSKTSNSDKFAYTSKITATGGFALTAVDGSPVSGNVATFTDTDNSLTASDFSAMVDWGDGLPAGGWPITGGNGSFSIDASHTYPAPGTYTITVTITPTTTGQTNTQTVDDTATVISPQSPAISATAATASSGGAALTGSVNPEDSPTTVRFEYGLDPEYAGHPGGPVAYDQATPEQDLGADDSEQTVTATLTGLLPNALYHVRLVATNDFGTADGPDQSFMTPEDPAPSPPQLGTTVEAVPVSGVVYFKLPPGAAGDSRAIAALSKGHGFLPLTEPRDIPFGSQLDTRIGALQLIAASAHPGKLQRGTFSGALFRPTQRRSGHHKGLVILSLLEGDFPGAPSYSECRVHGAGDGSGPSAQAAGLSGRILQTLHAREHRGRFRTRGHYSAATVRGTVWNTSDRCDGTLTVVHRGTVFVRDFHRRKTITVHAGHDYLARAPIKRK